MVLEILVCALATGGILLFLWGLIGFLVYPRGQEAILVYCISGAAPYLESYLHWIGWLCQTGLLHAKIILVDCGLSKEAQKRAQYLAAHDCRVLEFCQDAEMFTRE